MMADHQSRNSALATWADVSMATANASMELVGGIMAANFALWDTTLRHAPALAAAAAPEANAPAPRQPEPEARWWSPAPPARTEPGRVRSWYRAPYQSPFDPAFWMMPGHPTDHAATWLAPVAAAGLGAMLPRAPAANFMAPLQQDWLAAWAPPWLRPMLTEPNYVEAGIAAAAVGDVSGAFASYRSAGGHAVAQITQDVMVAAQRSIAEQTTSAMLKAWPLPFPLSLWMPR